MITLDLSRVDRKAQGPLELVSYWSHSKPHTKAQLERPKRLAQLDNQICEEKHTEFLWTWNGVCECWTLSLILSWTNSHYWLRDHTSWALVELEWRLKVFLNAYNLFFEIHHTKVHSLVLIFWNLQAHVIYYEWSRSVIFPLRTCIFPSSTPHYT